ncbi:MAG TPA: arylsulfatase [Acidimicrobiales bacterium]|nr:arylsulfatase [Acidimicrobiales bacterium]
MVTRPEFGGRIGDDWRSSEPWWPPVARPPAGAPNVVLVVLDDVGFAQLGCYGSDIATPVMDGLAAGGVRLTNFHTTALCSPTRACLLTGRNHHRNAMGRVADLAMGFPGYWGKPPKENGFLSEILRANGYATYAVGKWHLTPEDETNVAGLRDSWPLGRGFDRWYGFHGGETHQFVPALFHDNHALRPPREYHDGYHLSEDLADRAIEFVGDLRAVDAERRFFLYLATGACHSPHQPPRHWRERYAGAFDMGWDEWRTRTFERQLEMGVIPPGTDLTPRPSWVPAWETLDDAQRAVAARFMECFAGFLSHTDEQLGRVLAFLDEIGERDDTLVVLVSDNGASAEGGPDGSINDVRLTNLDPASSAEMQGRIDDIGGPLTHNNYPWGWTMAGNTPFRRWKREVHQGGVADPCIVSWPARLAACAGEARRQYAHAVDVLPTILDLVGIAPPDTIDYVPQTHFDGMSQAPLFVAGGIDAPAVRTTQHFEMLGSRAIYHQGWKAVTFHPVGPLYDDGLEINAPFEEDVWELYHVAEDASECHDVAAEHPERVAAMVELWWEQARRNDVLPLDNRVWWTIVHPKPDIRTPRDRFRYFAGGAPVPEPVAVNVRNRSHRITVDVDVPAGEPPNGVLLALGSALGGWSLHVLDGRPRYVHNLYGKECHVVEAEAPLGPGAHRVEYAFTKDEGLGGTGVLRVDGAVTAEGPIARFTPSGFNGVGVGVTCGYEWGPAIGAGYRAPFPFTGTIVRAEVEATGPVVRDPMAEVAAILAEQ